MQDSPVRAFIAVDIPADIRERITAVTKEVGAENLRPVGEDQLHVTLEFLGNLDERKVELAKNVVSGVNQKKFDVSLIGVGTFDVKRPRVIFAKIMRGSDELIGLYNMMHEGLSKLTTLEEREFSPHVTIARLKRFDRDAMKSAVDFINRYKDYDFGSFKCDSVRLKSSVLTQTGPVHTDLYVRELG